jgi:hypothetical protein
MELSNVTHHYHDDGNWKWKYECQFWNPSTDPKDWCYVIAFKNDYEGYLNQREVTCRYWKQSNFLRIHHDGASLEFYVENFKDIEAILKPLIKANAYIPYPIYESITKKRKDKLNKIKQKR